MNEQEILAAIEAADKEYADAKRAFMDAKRKVLDCETELLNAKLRKERLVEELRINRNTVPSATPEKSLRDLDLERFRAEHPELVEWARQRDLKRGQE